jgi:predicted AAA+ superfamily ATPase
LEKSAGMIKRLIEENLLAEMNKGFVVGLFGARRTGKTFLMNYLKEQLEDVLYVQGDNLDVAETLSQPRLSALEPLVKGYRYLFIDEAQEIQGIGKTLKLIADTWPDLKIFVTGSSALDLRNSIGEPLVGRSKFFYLFPVAQVELNESFLEAKTRLDQKLIFGGYPQVINADAADEKASILASIRNGYLLKDILMLDRIKDPVFIHSLLRLLAFQIGNDVSLSELASNLKVSHHTIQRYLFLLEQTFVIFSLQGFSRNLRKEYSKSPRYYFWDNGIRNAIINNYSPLNARDDTGKLWENYCQSERLKSNHYLGRDVSSFFWRTYDQKEIDLIEDSMGTLAAFEFKWGTKTAKPPLAFTQSYPGTSYEIINQDNYLSFIIPEFSQT